MKFRIRYTITTSEGGTRAWIMGKKFDTVAEAVAHLAKIQSQARNYLDRVIDLTIEEDK